MGYYYKQEVLDKFQGASGTMMLIRDVPDHEVVRFGGCLWQVCPKKGSGGGALVLAGPDDETHRAAGGNVAGMVGDNRVGVPQLTVVERLSFDQELTDAMRIIRMPYGRAKGEATIAYEERLALEAVAAAWPDIDVHAVVTAYRRGDRVHDKKKLAFAAAKYASIASITTDPDEAGDAMGGLSAYIVFVLFCQETGKFVVDSESGHCPACHKGYSVSRGAEAWPEYRAHEGHSFVLGAGLPFDDQKVVTIAPPAE